MVDQYLTPDELSFVESLGSSVVDMVVEAGHGNEVLSVLSASLLVAAFASLIEIGDYEKIEILRKQVLDTFSNMGTQKVLN